jgi:hypothetical protein
MTLKLKQLFVDAVDVLLPKVKPPPAFDGAFEEFPRKIHLTSPKLVKMKYY